MKFFIFGYFGYNNFGDEAILCSFIERVKLKYKEVEFYILSKDTPPTPKPQPPIPNPQSPIPNIHSTLTTSYYPFSASHFIQRFNFKEVIEGIRCCDFVISPGGGLFQDTTSFRSILYYISLLLIANFFKRPVILLSQGIGPINYKLSKPLLNIALNKCKVITVRDVYSLDLIRNLGVNRPKVQVTSDMTFSLGVNDIVKDITFDSKGGLVVGIAPRFFKNDIKPQLIGDISHHLKSKYNARIYLFPFYPSEDIKFINETIKYAKVDEVVDCKNYKEAIREICKINLMIGIRLHSVIFSALCGVPSLSICYDQKVKYTSEQLAQKCVNPGEDRERIFILLDEIINNLEREKVVVAQKTLEQRSLCEGNFDILFKTIEKL